MVDKLEESRLRVVIVVTQPFQKLVRLSQIQDIQRSPRLAGADVKLAASFAQERDEPLEIECRWNLDSHSLVESVFCDVVDGALSCIVSMCVERKLQGDSQM